MSAAVLSSFSSENMNAWRVREVGDWKGLEEEIRPWVSLEEDDPIYRQPDIMIRKIETMRPYARQRNFSGPSSTGARPVLDNSRSSQVVTPPPELSYRRADDSGPKDGHSRDLSCRKRLDKSQSNSDDRINGNHTSNGGRGVNSARYKTELCRPFEESGHCKYGDKCQFAHGAHELRNLPRHPKYKTERCRTYHTVGFCPYGPRCHFIHNDEERERAQQLKRKQPGRPNNLRGLTSMDSSFESVCSSITPDTLSPDMPKEDFTIGHFKYNPSYPTTQSPTNYDSTIPSPPRSRSNTIFNFPASDAASTTSPLTPLNVQTQQFNFVNNVRMLCQNQRNNYTAATAFNTNSNVLLQQAPTVPFRQNTWFEDHQLQEELEQIDNRVQIPTPCVSPLGSSASSTSNESMGSSSSLEEVPMVTNVLDMGCSMRLPIFTNLNKVES